MRAQAVPGIRELVVGAMFVMTLFILAMLFGVGLALVLSVIGWDVLTVVVCMSAALVLGRVAIPNVRLCVNYAMRRGMEHA